MLSRLRHLRSPRTTQLVAFGAIVLALCSVRCTANYDDVEFVPDAVFEGAAGGTGKAGGAGQAGAAGKASAGTAGATGGAAGTTTAGKAGASGAGVGGAAGAAGQSAGQSGAAGKGGGNAGTGGLAGQGGSPAGAGGASGAAGKSGTAGAGGGSGQAGKGGGAAGMSGAGSGGAAGTNAGNGGIAGASGGTAGNGGSAGTNAGNGGNAGTSAGNGGASGGGSAGASGAAGAGGATGPEMCDNGLDDDQDGLTDCADTQDCASSTCAPAVDPNWIGPLSLIDGDVDCGAQQKVYHAFADLTAAPAVCDTCKCDPQQGATCTQGLHGVTGPDCEFDPCGFLALNASVSCASASPLEAGCGVAAGGLEYTGAKVQGGTCQPSAITPPSIPPTTWGKEVTACQATQLGGGCAGGVCAVAPPSGAALCIAQAGDQVCPTGYGTKRVYHESLQDDRACSACACGGAAGGTCSPKITIFSDAGCSTQQLVFTTAYTCSIVPQVAGYFSSRSYSYVPGTVTGATCPPSGGASIGAATPSAPITFCCAP